jgi:hypothetical protein
MMRHSAHSSEGGLLMAVPAKAAQRIATAMKRFQPIVGSAKGRDVNESDTVVIVTDMLSELFGYDKYTEVTTEHAIRGTYCDIALRLDGALKIIIEVKAVGIDFRDQHVKQAVDYAANQGVDWVILTNAAQWRVYRVSFSKPIAFLQVLDIDFLSADPRNSGTIEALYLLSREGTGRDALADYVYHQQATSRHLIAAILLDDPVLQVLRRELRRLNPDVHADVESLRGKLAQEVLKRETVEGEEAEAAAKAVAKAKSQALRATKAKRAVEAPASAYDDDARGDGEPSDPELAPPPQDAAGADGAP